MIIGNIYTYCHNSFISLLDESGKDSSLVRGCDVYCTSDFYYSTSSGMLVYKLLQGTKLHIIDTNGSSATVSGYIYDVRNDNWMYSEFAVQSTEVTDSIKRALFGSREYFDYQTPGHSYPEDLINVISQYREREGLPGAPDSSTCLNPDNYFRKIVRYFQKLYPGRLGLDGELGKNTISVLCEYLAAYIPPYNGQNPNRYVQYPNGTQHRDKRMEVSDW